jgi:hypothetical protein
VLNRFCLECVPAFHVTACVLYSSACQMNTVDVCDAGGTRELLWYDVRNTSAAAGSYTVDTGSGTLLPLFDADTGMMVMPSKGDGSIRFGRSVNFDERHFACPPCDDLRFIVTFVHGPFCADCSSGATTPLCKYRWKLLRSLTSASQCCQSAPSMSRRASCCDSPGSPPILSTLFLLELLELAWTCFRTTCIPHVCPGSPAPAFRIILQEGPCQNCPGSLCSLRACRCVH